MHGSTGATLRRISRSDVGGAMAGLALIVALVVVLTRWHGINVQVATVLPLFFLIPVLLAAALGGRGAGVIVAVIAVLSWDWYFIPPLYTVTVYNPRDLLTLVVFLAVALLIGQLPAVERRRAEEAVRRARGAEALYNISMSLIGGDRSVVLTALTHQLCDTFALEACALLLPSTIGDGWQTVALSGHLPPALRVEERRNIAAVATWVRQHCRPSGLGEGALSGKVGRVVWARRAAERVRFLPVQVGSTIVGVLQLVQRANHPFDPEEERLLATFVNSVAIALEQARLADEERTADLARESDRLKSALLSSVSHDLRTPLAGIKAAASSLLQSDVQWSEEDRRSFAADIDAETDRLTRLVSNLLDLSRIEAGALQPRAEWDDGGELATRVVERLRSHLADHPIVLEVAAPLPPLWLDAVQIEQVLGNLIENAAKYSPPQTPITVRVGLSADDPPTALRIAVSDCGPGIARTEQERIFDKFYRVAGTARRTGGTGMGLAIVKGLVEAHGGRVAVASAPGNGSTFTVILPLPSADAQRYSAVGAQQRLEL